MRYGEDVPERPRRLARIDDLHAQEVMLRAAIIEEYRSIFNVASMFADALAAVQPDHPYVHVARFEGMLNRFEMKPKEDEKEIPQPEEQQRVQSEVETGEVCERPGVPEEMPRQCESIPQADGADSPTSETVQDNS